MNRNRTFINERSQAACAVLTLFEIVKLLRLDRDKFESMFREDVSNNITMSSIQDYADGLRDAYITAIIKDHCEFVYFIDGERLTVDERMQKGGGQIDAVCGYQWKDTEFNFTPFSKEVDLWI